MAIVTGCVTPRVDLVEAGAVAVDMRLHESMSVRHIYVYQEGECVIVKGLAITPGFGLFSKPTGHLDIQYIDPVGRLLHEGYARLLPDSTPMSGRRIPKFMDVEEAFRFSARAPIRPEPGSVIRITHHEAPHGDGRPSTEQQPGEY